VLAIPELDALVAHWMVAQRWRDHLANGISKCGGGSP